MKKFFKPAYLVLYVLALVVFFFIGIYISILSSTTENQGLSGGAILFSWGLVFAFVALIVSIGMVSRLSHSTVVRVNWVLFIALIILYGITHYRYEDRQKEKARTEQQEKEEWDDRKNKKALRNKTTSMLIRKQKTTTKAIQDIGDPKLSINTEMGLGMFFPNGFENSTLYFYANVNLEKTVDDHIPLDSLVFSKDQYNNTTTTYGPPWLYPEHLKLDYGILVFKAMAMGHDFIKVEVNRITKKSMYLNKNQGSFKPWSEFLLSVNSLEFIDDTSKKVHIKPLSNSSQVNIGFSFMQPILIEEDWIYVRLVNDSLKEQGKGWIRWKKNGKLLVRYSLLS